MDVVYLGVALVSAGLCTVLFSSHSRRRRANEPPGPWQLPVIGSLHHFVGQLPHRAMRDLARRHGPVMLIQLGEVPTLVVSSREGAREVMKTHDLAFATRPLNATMRVLTNGGRDIVFAPYGDYWRQLRKIAVSELLSAGRVLSFRAIREEEVAAMLRDVGDAAASGSPVDLRARFTALVTDIRVRAVMGDCRFKECDTFLRALDRSWKLAAGFNPPDLWPSSRLVRYLSGALVRAKEYHDTGNAILDAIIQERLDVRTMEGQVQNEHTSLLDVLLNMHKEGRIGIDAVKYVIFDILTLGNETTILEWAMAELIKNPEVMQKATTEVRHAFKAHTRVAEDGLGELPYLHLVIRETLRLHTPTPLLTPRECRQPCQQLLGYDVPQGTQVVVNAWALARDTRYWPDAPDEFRPERFEVGEAAAADFWGAHFSFLPFGAGRRMCPGIAFSLANIELTLASLLFHFDWEGPARDELDMAEEFGITVRRKAGLLLRPLLQVPVPGG